MILLDTHVLLWFINDSSTLPPSVRRKIKTAQNSSSVYVSAITFWEIAMLTKKGRLQLQYDLLTWIEIALSIPFLNVIDTSVDLYVKSILLTDPFHADPADRIIVATAQQMGATLITKDKAMLAYPHVHTFWGK